MRVKEERDEELEEEEEEEDLSNSSSTSIYVNSRSNSGNMVCDACGKRSARWYCSADDAYLCHSCDQSVHAANAVSLRHERVSLLPEEDEEAAPTNPVTTTTSAQQQKQQKQQKQERSESSRHDGSSAESKSFFKSSSNGGSVVRLKRRRSSSKEDQCPAAAFGSPLRPPASPIHWNSPCKSKKKMIKLEIPELAAEEWGRTAKQEEELEQEQQEEVHTVPVFDSSARNEQEEFQTEEEEEEAMLQVANMGGSDHSPTSGIATEAEEQDGEEEQEEGQEAEEDSMDEADIERFLNSGADYCCEDDEDAEMGSLIVAPPPNTTTTTTTTEDLEFLGFCCDEISRSCPGFEQQQLDEDYYDSSRFDFAIRKNNASVSDYGEVITDDGGGDGIESLKTIKVENDGGSDFYLGDLLGASGGGGLSNAKLEHENYDQNFQQMQQHHLQRRICLRLDYEDVLNAWSDRRPFLTSDSSSAARANKPMQAVAEDSTSDIAGSSDVGVVPDLSCGSGAGQSVDQAGQVPVVNLGDEGGPNAAAGGGGGREARVTRYREKRRTRLFSKKIRYEVRKLNAERRPRLKGRFVKRCSNGD